MLKIPPCLGVFNPLTYKQSKNVTISLSKYLSAATSFYGQQSADAIILETIFAMLIFSAGFFGKMTVLESLHTDTARGKI